MQPDECWQHIPWSEETKINLFGSDGVVCVWRGPGQDYHSNCDNHTHTVGKDESQAQEAWQEILFPNVIITHSNKDRGKGEILAHWFISSLLIEHICKLK